MWECVKVQIKDILKCKTKQDQVSEKH